MNKFFDYLIYDMPLQKVRELLDYIRRFAAVFAGDVPVEGRMGGTLSAPRRWGRIPFGYTG